MYREGNMNLGSDYSLYIDAEYTQGIHLTDFLSYSELNKQLSYSEEIRDLIATDESLKEDPSTQIFADMDYVSSFSEYLLKMEWQLES